MCKKVKHPTHEAACITAKRMKNKRLNVYKCGECHAWHLGNSNAPFRIQERIDQILGARP